MILLRQGTINNFGYEIILLGQGLNILILKDKYFNEIQCAIIVFLYYIFEYEMFCGTDQALIKECSLKRFYSNISCGNLNENKYVSMNIKYRLYKCGSWSGYCHLHEAQ